MSGPILFSDAKFETKKVLEFFHLQSALDSEFFTGGVWAPTFLVMLNLRLKIFQNFFIYRVLWTLNFSEGCLGLVFSVMPNLTPKKFLDFFCLQSALDSEYFTGGVWALTFLVMLYLRSKIVQNFFI